MPSAAEQELQLCRLTLSMQRYRGKSAHFSNFGDKSAPSSWRDEPVPPGTGQHLCLRQDLVKEHLTLATDLKEKLIEDMVESGRGRERAGTVPYPGR